MAKWPRDRMIEEMELRGLGALTFRSYIRAMARFSFYMDGRDLDQLDIPDLKNYQLYLLRDKGLAPNSVNGHMSAIKFYYRCVLGRPGYSELLPRVRATRKIPTILSEAEIAAMINSVHNVRYKAIIMLMYSAGLRNAELRNLKVQDIDSKRMVIQVREGKGQRDRQALLSELALRCLRTYWRLFRKHSEIKSEWFFNPTKNCHTGELDKKMSHTALGYILRVAARAAGIKKKSRPMCFAILSQFI